MGINLYPYQVEAVHNLKNGSILVGGVGSGKSRTGLAYYYILNGGDIESDNYVKMKNPIDLYIITTARKRDTHEWEKDMIPFMLFTEDNLKIYKHEVHIDSWNNIKKYENVRNAFFIFDEQRVVGYGAWSKAFIKIAKNNKWILLSATPGDTWSDYIPVFIANGYFSSKTHFEREHVIFNPYVKFRQVQRYVDTGILVKYRNDILVQMDYATNASRHFETVLLRYNKDLYKTVWKDRWNIYENRPIENVSELCSVLRKIVNSDDSRVEAIYEIFEKHPKLIIFYNYNYELDILKDIDFGVEVAEWNGHVHEPIPDTESWVYLVQYTAGAEGWNCTLTNAIAFYSLNYSYKIMSQSAGRIDRLNTPYNDLYYYYFQSFAPIDLAISRALTSKKKFNESLFVKTRKGNK